MPYSIDFRRAARRHLEAADKLHRAAKRRDVAGYLYGLSAELAVKEMMRSSNMRPLDSTKRREDPFYAHFPELKTMLRDSASGRRHGDLRRIAEDSRLMQNWDTAMRYAPATDIQETWVENWAEQARELVARMDTE
jgi:hypothetical protein